MFWLVPTRPALRINYLEKLYKVKEIEKLREFREDNYDENKKIFGVEVKKSQFEKKILGLLIVVMLCVWYFYLNEVLVNFWLKP